MKQLAENLRHIRSRQGLTQQQIAKAIHVDRTTYNKYEAGTAEPPLDTCIYLCIVLDTTPNELLGWNVPTDNAQPMSGEEIEEYAQKKWPQDFMGDPSWDFMKTIKNFLTESAAG